MADTYFDYALSKCRMPSISAVCGVESTRKALQERAAKGFNGCNNITADWRLLRTVSVCLQNQDIINSSRLNADAMTIYERCREVFLSDCRMGYESFFDHLTELNWLLASVQGAKENNQRTTKLLSDPVEVNDFIKSHLLELYNSAVRDNNECVYIKEALQARKKLFSGLYDFQYEQSRYYLSQEFLHSDLEQMESEYKDNSICKMALFYGLTATAALRMNWFPFCLAIYGWQKALLLNPEDKPS